MKYVNWIEYDDGHYLAIGVSSPWNRKIQIRVPMWIARYF